MLPTLPRFAPYTHAGSRLPAAIIQVYTLSLTVHLLRAPRRSTPTPSCWFFILLVAFLLLPTHHRFAYHLPSVLLPRRATTLRSLCTASPPLFSLCCLVLYTACAHNVLRARGLPFPSAYGLHGSVRVLPTLLLKFAPTAYHCLYAVLVCALWCILRR